MKKTVKVEDILTLAKQDVVLYHLLMNDGNYEVATMVEHRIQSFQSIIMILAVGDCKDYDNKREEIHKEIWGE